MYLNRRFNACLAGRQGLCGLSIGRNYAKSRAIYLFSAPDASGPYLKTAQKNENAFSLFIYRFLNMRPDKNIGM